MAVARKKPQADFVVRLVGPNVRPWVVPMRALARVLAAVQRLVEQREDDSESQAIEKDRTEPARILHLMDVKSGSAAYAVASPDRQTAIAVLSETRLSIADPDTAEWSEATLSSVEDLSDVARSVGCEIEFCVPSKRGQPGDVLLRITPDTYRDISEGAFIQAPTSIYAKIERVGGATEMHCGIRLPDSPRKMVICRVASTDLVRELGQYMYQHVVLTGRAKWWRHNWRLKNLLIESFEPPKTGSILETLERAHAVGGDAWDRIEDPDAFLAETREP